MPNWVDKLFQDGENLTGIVTKWDLTRGFGFIKAVPKNELQITSSASDRTFTFFVHYTELTGQYRENRVNDLPIGEFVEFKGYHGLKGNFAKQVKPYKLPGTPGWFQEICKETLESP